MRPDLRPSGLAEIDWPRPSAKERARQRASVEHIKAQVVRAALKMVRDIVKRRARAMLADPGQLEMIAPGLSEMTPHDMVAEVARLKCAARSLRQRGDPLVGRVDAHNLNAAALVARLLRRAERRQSLTREAA
ncbi:MAG: hypothetical protein ACHQAY_19485 [Hyphomicrobiales bacterium]